MLKKIFTIVAISVLGISSVFAKPGGGQIGPGGGEIGDITCDCDGPSFEQNEFEVEDVACFWVITKKDPGSLDGLAVKVNHYNNGSKEGINLNNVPGNLTWCGDSVPGYEKLYYLGIVIPGFNPPIDLPESVTTVMTRASDNKNISRDSYSIVPSE